MDLEFNRTIVRKLMGTSIKIPKCTYEKTELYKILEQLGYVWVSGKKISEKHCEYIEGREEIIKLGHWHYGEWVISVGRLRENNCIEAKEFLSRVKWLLSD